MGRECNSRISVLFVLLPHLEIFFISLEKKKGYLPEHSRKKTKDNKNKKLPVFKQMLLCFCNLLLSILLKFFKVLILSKNTIEHSPIFKNLLFCVKISRCKTKKRFKL